ncbi:hypothetical protein ACLB1T_03950 [Escherichia coli]
MLEGHDISEKRFLLEAQVCLYKIANKRISTAINEVVLFVTESGAYD